VNPALHGLVFGFLFLIAFVLAMAGISSLTPSGGKRVGLAVGATWALAALGWLAVISGLLMMARYNARPPEGTTDLSAFPRALLLSKPETQLLHAAGMIWKLHVAWFAPILTTAVAAVLSAYASEIANRPAMRRLLMRLLLVVFVAAAIAGGIGYRITGVAPLR
jgi:hypothetical protein